jgi:hypothetical protein
VAVSPEVFDIDVGALIALGGVASVLFWRLLARVEKKVDHVIDNMVTRDACAERHRILDEDFDHHYHIPDDGVAVIKGEKK